jgi:hypothetical protein
VRLVGGTGDAEARPRGSGGKTQMTIRNRPLVTGSAALALFFFAATLAGGEAQARPGWWRPHRGGGVGAAVGAVLAGVAIGAAIEAHVETAPPVVQVQPYYYPPPPCCYQPPPVYVPPVYVPPPPPPPAPVVVYQAPPPPPAPVVGIALSGLAQTAGTENIPLAGTAAAIQYRTSSHSLVSLELQSLGARRSDGVRREDIAGMLGARLFLWDAALAPYLDVAGGIGQASLEGGGTKVSAGQLIGRYGVGLELRLGRHLVFEGQIAQVHHLRSDDEDGSGGGGITLARLDKPSLTPATIADHERATEVRGGIAFRF